MVMLLVCIPIANMHPYLNVCILHIHYVYLYILDEDKEVHFELQSARV